jgi:MazG family protein
MDREPMNTRATPEEGAGSAAASAGERFTSRADPAPTGTPPDAGALDRALGLVRFLRANCPWDRAQTPETLIPYLLEETHEVVDAIHDRDAQALEGELGDLLLNVAFQVVLGEEQGHFTASSVAARLEEKMRRRHPHLYGLGEREEWEALKTRERGERGVLDGLARGLDPLTAAHRIQERVSGVGFDWADYRGAFDKVAEELEEVRAALEQGADGRPPTGASARHPDAADALEEELGDLLFAAVNLVRLAGRHPTSALERANRKFRRRFERLEALAKGRRVVLAEAGLAELDVLWDELKAEER